jgi:hypothetical protein
MDFPQYRRYRNGKHYFRIDSPESFEEVRALGNKWIVEQRTVRILPDRNFVHDLLYHFEAFGEKIPQSVYDNIREQATGIDR